MKEKMKYLSSVLVALLMVLGITLPSRAAAAPSAQDKATVTVQNVEAGATVVAYQIVKATYDATGFTGYTKADGVTGTINDVTKPTNAEVMAIVNGGVAGLTSVTLNYAAPDYKADLPAGYWIVLAKGNGVKLYNPMLAGTYYTGADNTMNTNAVIDANSKWSLNSETLYAKSSEKPKLDKTIVNPKSQNKKGDDVAIGDEVSFKLATTMPAYSRDYKDVVFTINDTLSKGLTHGGAGKVVVTVGGQTVEAGAGTYTLTVEGQKTKVAFAAEYIYGLAGKTDSERVVNVTYKATLNSEAGTNFNANTNTATLTYSNDPTKDDDGRTETTPEVKTYHYTFEIDGNLLGDGTKTKEVWKSGEKESETARKPLAGATFKLTRNDGKEYTATSDNQGLLNFKGLDAGTYTLVETNAPQGYSLNKKEYPVVITAEYNEDGTLKTYSITIDGVATSTYSATYQNGTPEVTKNVEVSTEIQNTPLSELPSTGGIGTFIFTAVGVSLMGVAVIAFFLNKKRSKSNK